VSKIRIEDDGSYLSVNEEGQETRLEKAKITLNDCLACSIKMACHLIEGTQYNVSYFIPLVTLDFLSVLYKVLLDSAV
jgi:hypothetical protein